MPKDGWNNDESSDTHKLNEVIAMVLADKSLTAKEIEAEIKKSWGGKLPRGAVQSHLRGLMKSTKNKRGYVMEEPIRYRLTETGKKAWSRYRARLAAANKKPARNPPNVEVT